MDEKELDTGLTDDAFDLAFEAAAAGTDDAEDFTEGEEAKGEEAKGDESAAKTPEELAAEQAVADKAEADRKAAEQAAAEKATADRKAAEKAAADKAAADARAEAERKATERADKEKFTDEEQKVLDSVGKDFTEVRAAFTAFERTIMARVDNIVESKVAAALAQVDQRLTPISNTIQHVAQNSHQAAILEKHTDAFDILPQVEDWVKTQPKFLQAEYNRVLDKGSSAEVVELLDTFKAAAGTPKSEAEKEAEAKAAADRKKKEKKLQEQEGVHGRNTQKRSAAVDPDDFDGAFDKYAATA